MVYVQLVKVKRCDIKCVFGCQNDESTAVCAVALTLTHVHCGLDWKAVCDSVRRGNRSRCEDVTYGGRCFVWRTIAKASSWQAGRGGAHWDRAEAFGYTSYQRCRRRHCFMCRQSSDLSVIRAFNSYADVCQSLPTPWSWCNGDTWRGGTNASVDCDGVGDWRG